MMNTLHTVGIASLGIALPDLAFDVRDLARIRKTDPEKYLIGMGCDVMALCSKDTTVADLAIKAAQRALSRWQGKLEDIGLIAVGTETALDMSRPLSAWVAEALNLKGSIRSYEVKHACYGGTLALRQALEWKLSGASMGKAALVIAADISLYAPEDSGEPTQGAGAIAMIIDEALIAKIHTQTYPYSEPAFDFWRPVKADYPLVEGKFSLECYCRAAASCFQQFILENTEFNLLSDFYACCFHVPFPKMVKKAVSALGEKFGWTLDQIEAFFQEKVSPSLAWNRKIGNSYTASLWISVANALCQLPENKLILAFSYGSGFGAELLMLESGPLASQGQWQADIKNDLAQRKLLNAQEYIELRKFK